MSTSRVTIRDVRLAYAHTEAGHIHYAECGDGRPLLCLHQTPRSWDEYREALPLLGRTCRAIAMDTLGMGASSSPSGSATIEAYAAGVTALADSLDLERFCLLGHHTGGVIAIEVAAATPDRVAGLVLSSTPWIDAESREQRRARPPIDSLPPSADGASILAWWRRRSAFYPAERPDLLERCLSDALRARDPEEGHAAVARYRMEERIGRVRAPALCIGHSDDPFAFPEFERLRAYLPQSEGAVIRGGMVPLEYKAAELVSATLAFLERL